MEPNPVLFEGIASLLSAEPDLELVGRAMSTHARVDLLPQLQPDVILLDLDPAGASSAITVRKLHGECSNASIIILTSYELDPAAASVIQAGAAAVIAKHQLESNLVELIRRNYAGRTNT
jgi:two-component system nitrate/nitrite response regulator NarL